MKRFCRGNAMVESLLELAYKLTQAGEPFVLARLYGVNGPLLPSQEHGW